MKTKLLSLAALGLALGGCTTRHVVRFEDHPIQKQTYVETIRHDNYFVTQSSTHEFWLCEDGEDTLSCKRTCDGKTDLACPADGVTVSFGSDGGK